MKVLCEVMTIVCSFFCCCLVLIFYWYDAVMVCITSTSLAAGSFLFIQPKLSEYLIRKLWEQSKARRVHASVFVFSSAFHRAHHSPQTVYFSPVASFSFPDLYARILPLHSAVNKGAERLHYTVTPAADRLRNEKG